MYLSVLICSLKYGLLLFNVVVLCSLCLSPFLFIPRLFYMVVVFFVFRMRFYAAWCGAEASCISAGLGCYPEKSLSKPGGGPTVNYRYIKTRLASIFTGGTHHQSLTQDVCFVKISFLSFIFCFCFCAFLSLAASPDPTAEETYDFRTIQNIDCYNTDFCVKVRHGMRYWNMSVQWWLHHYIYPNSPFKSYTLR